MSRACSAICMILGVIGVVFCVVCLAAVWFYYPQLDRKSEEVYTRIDDALILIEDRIDMTHDRVVIVNAMTEDFRFNLTKWLKDKHLDHRHVGHRAEIIAGHLHQAQDGVEFAVAFLTKIQNAQRLAHPFRKPPETEKLDALMDELVKIQTQVQEVVSSIDQIREEAENSGDTSQLESTIEHSLQQVVDIMEIVNTADTRLESLSGRVAEAQTKADELETRIKTDLWWARFGATIIFPWMALGQIALVVTGRRGGERSTKP